MATSEMFALGQAVRVKATVTVMKRSQGLSTSRELIAKPNQCEGIVVGRRTAPEGWIESFEDGGGFHQTGHKRLVLVAISLYRIVRALEVDVEAR